MTGGLVIAKAAWTSLAAGVIAALAVHGAAPPRPRAYAQMEEIYYRKAPAEAHRTGGTGFMS